MERKAQEKPKAEEPKREKSKPLKLTYKEKMALESLPEEIEKLEKEIKEKNHCLSDPKCYEEIGISLLAQELAEIEEYYEKKIEELFRIEEKLEECSR